MEPPTASTAMVSHTPKAKGDSYPQCMTYVFSPFTSRVFDRNPNAAYMHHMRGIVHHMYGILKCLVAVVSVLSITA